MKKRGFIFLIMASFLMATAFVSCEKENNGDDNHAFSLVGEWSAIDADEASIPQVIDATVDEMVRIHFSFKDDGTCTITMPAWDERRYGSYTVEGNKLSITITKLEWVLPRNNGYTDVYDQYGAIDFADWCEKWADEAHLNLNVNPDEHNHVMLDYMGRDLIYFSHPEFDAENACRHHMQ